MRNLTGAGLLVAVCLGAGSLAFTTAAGVAGFEFVIGSGENRTLVIRDAQHEHVFEER